MRLRPQVCRPGSALGAELGGSSSQLEFGEESQRGSTSGVFQLGIGLDVKLWRSLKVRGEVRDFWSGTPTLGVDTGKSRQHNFNVGGGVVWQFGRR
jgi:hypothetical protein